MKTLVAALFIFCFLQGMTIDKLTDRILKLEEVTAVFSKQPKTVSYKLMQLPTQISAAPAFRFGAPETREEKPEYKYNESTNTL